MRIREYFVIPGLTLVIFYRRTKFGESCFIHSRDMIVGIKTENESYMTPTMLVSGVI